MSNEFLQAAEDAKVLLRGFAGAAKLAAAFEKAGSAIQAQGEAETALAALIPKVAEATQQVMLAEENMRAAEREAMVIVANAKAQAQSIVNDAQIQSDLVLANAESNAAGVRATVQAALDSAEHDIAEAAAKRDAIYAACEALEIRANDARAYLAKLQG